MMSYAGRHAALARCKEAGERTIGPYFKNLRAPRRSFDECRFDLAIRNDGPVTIRDCLLSVSVTNPSPVECDDRSDAGQPRLFQFSRENRTVSVSDGSGREEVQTVDVRLFPEHTMPFPSATFEVHVPAGESISSVTVDWRLYLDDAPSQSGTIDLGLELSRGGK